MMPKACRAAHFADDAQRVAERDGWKVIYLSSSETMNIEVHWRRIKWLNVQSVELKFRSRRKRGKWQVAPTNKEKEWNLR